MICTQTEALESFMKENLKASRYIHSLGVQSMAGKLAGIYGEDVRKAEFAGRYHDIAKCFSNEVMNGYVREYSLPDRYLDNNALAHSKVAAGLLEHRFGVTEEDILDAVRSHTTGRGGMSMLEEIVFVADAIEENRDYPGLRELQELAAEDIDKACLEILDFTIESVKLKGRDVDTDTIDAYRYISDRINGRDKQ